MVHEADELARLLKVLAVGTQGAVSQHLRVMRDAGLVIDEKRGYYVHYRLNEQTLNRWRKQIDGLLAPGPYPCTKTADAKGRKTDAAAWHLAYRFLRDRGRAEDVGQEQFLRVLRRDPPWPATVPFRTYLYQIIAR